jgi:isoquinoline 1-oxidoreductase beta subunit
MAQARVSLLSNAPHVMSTPSSPSVSSLDRREFLRVTALAGGGLLVGAYLDFGTSQAAAQAAAVAPGDFAPNVFIRISPSGAVALIAPNSEMGQGAKTALPMLVAEELDVPWASVTVTQADLNPAFGRQFAVGSQSTVANYAPLRQAGASARAMLVEAAAQTWGVSPGECSTSQGEVIHAATNRRLGYGALATKAATLAVPASVALKDPKDFKLVGTRVPGVDNRRIVTGEPLFGIDQHPPGLVYAAYVKCRVSGGKPVSANLEDVKRLPGVKDAFILDGITGLAPGVAIVAASTWQAFQAAEQLKVEWNPGPGAGQSSTEMAQQAEDLARATPAPSWPAGTKAVAAVYHYPFLAHATLEPQNSTAVFRNGVMELWCPTQIPSVGQGLVTQGLGLAAANVVVHVTRLGGGFGRRRVNEPALEVAAIARRLAGTPVKLTWMREHDFSHDQYRSNGWHHFQAGLDAAGKVVDLQDAFVKMLGGPGDMTAGGFPFTAIPGSRVVSSKLNGTIPTGYWRAPGDNGNTWATQSFVDELAHAAGREPLEFTLGLLAAVPAPGAGRGGRGGPGGAFSVEKMTAVLKLATDKAGWGRKLPRGQGLGFAITHTNNAHVAVVAEVTVSPKGVLRIDRLTAAVDAGIIVNLSSAEGQIQGAMLDGISAAWHQKITIEQGAAAQTSFAQYPQLRMNEAPPAVAVHFVPSTSSPTGLGEPGLPAAAPALCNAIFAATGRRIRTLPLAGQDLTWS